MSATTFLPAKGATGCPCPSWCTADSPLHQQHGTDHQRRIGHIVATALEAELVDDGFRFPGVLVSADQEDADDPGRVAVEVIAGLDRHAAADLRPAEARRLAELLVRAADVVEGVR